MVLEQLDGEWASISVSAGLQASPTLDAEDRAGGDRGIVHLRGTLAFRKDRSELDVTDRERPPERSVKKDPGRARKRNARKLAEERNVTTMGSVYLRFDSLRSADLWTFDGNDYFQLTMEYGNCVVVVSGF